MSEKMREPSKVLIICCVIILGIIILIKIRIQKVYENPLENISSEVESMPNYVVYGSLYSAYGEVSVSGICKQQSPNYNLEEILCVKDDVVYFIYSILHDKTYCWAIGAIDLVTLEFQTHCKMIEPVELYGYAEFTNEYKKQNGYYFDNQIILNDHQTVLIYDIKLQCSRTYDYDEYVFPEHTMYGECIDTQTIKLSRGHSSKIYTLQEMAQKSDSIAEIFELHSKKTWDDNSYLHVFFSQYSVQFIGNDVYTIGQCLNSQGYAYAVIFKYNEKNDSWMYVTNIRSATGDIVHGRCYVIP